MQTTKANNQSLNFPLLFKPLNPLKEHNASITGAALLRPAPERRVVD